jgi:hypothetical protein
MLAEGTRLTAILPELAPILRKTIYEGTKEVRQSMGVVRWTTIQPPE